MDPGIIIFVLFTILGTDCVGNQTIRHFPKNFKFGAASAAYQIEGGWNADDKSENIWDYAVHSTPQKILNGQNGDTACDSYHQYKRDVEMLRELGVDFYRFSISWTRILPLGFDNFVSRHGVTYYNNLINELLKYNIQPIVTMYHWDLPQSLQDLGGWANPLIVTWFKDYAHVLFKFFGDRVKTWITINEPHLICHNGYSSEGPICLAPFFNYSGIVEYQCMYNILKSHAGVYHMYKDVFRPIQKGQIGISLQIVWALPGTNNVKDVTAASDYFECRSGLYIQPIFGTGDFPSNCIQKIANKSKIQGFYTSRLPQFTAEEIKYIKGSADFLGINHYTTILVYENTSLKEPWTVPSWFDDVGVYISSNKSYPSTASPWFKVVADGFREALNHIYRKYNNLTMMITENGFATSEGLNDDKRVEYCRQYLNALLNAILIDGVNVTGYTYWTLMDNFEWVDGYSRTFGLYQVNFTDPKRKRTARKSALVYRDIVKTKMIDPNYNPINNEISKGSSLNWSFHLWLFELGFFFIFYVFTN